MNWCKKQGMRLTEPSESLAEEYYKSAEETLRVSNLIKDSGSNMWLATQKYYTEYLLACAVLMRIGVKSEIHGCTIEVVRLLEKEEIIPFNFSHLLEADKHLRIENQYYLKNIPVKYDSLQMRHVLLAIREVLDALSTEKIEMIRKKI